MEIVVNLILVIFVRCFGHNSAPCSRMYVEIKWKFLLQASAQKPEETTKKLKNNIGSDKCSAGSAQTAQPQKERVMMNTQIQGGLVEIARPPASECQVRTEGEADFVPPALCRHPSNHPEVEKSIGTDNCSAGSAQAAQPQKERATMNTQIQCKIVYQHA